MQRQTCVLHSAVDHVDVGIVSLLCQSSLLNRSVTNSSRKNTHSRKAKGLNTFALTKMVKCIYFRPDSCVNWMLEWTSYIIHARTHKCICMQHRYFCRLRGLMYKTWAPSLDCSLVWMESFWAMTIIVHATEKQPNVFWLLQRADSRRLLLAGNGPRCCTLLFHSARSLARVIKCRRVDW